MLRHSAQVEDPPRRATLSVSMPDPITSQLIAFIRDVPDFPKPGIVFKDFTPLMADPRALALAVELMANPYRGRGVELVVGAESRGFIFGTAIAQALSAGFIPVRKAGKLPCAVRGVTYALEYGTDRLEMHSDAVAKGTRVLIVDDLLATGGTLSACAQLVHEAGATILGITVLIELLALQGRSRVAGYGEVHAVLRL
jgi:adenine phosphoribosyltransferase